MSSYIIKGEKHDWELVCGLEVHCQVKSQSKLFSNSSTKFGSTPNDNVELLDAGMPGMLPSLNKFVLEQGVKTALGLNAKVNLFSEFARKNYFYADSPLGYQITQDKHPIMGEGKVILDLEDNTTKEINIERMHLETDAGKSMHDQHPKNSLIDFNRTGIALMEIVSKPDISSPEEAGEYLKKIRSIVRYLNTCDGNMDEGSMRCDANVSVRPVGSKELRTRCELKNINSIRFVMQAIEYEVHRQIELYEDGKGDEIVQETRLYDTEKNITRSMRSKENANDYRYFPEPDLLPVIITQKYVDDIKEKLPELPDQKQKRFIKEYNLSPYDTKILINEQDIAQYFEEVVQECNEPKLSANWVTTNLFSLLKEQNKTIQQSPISAKNIGKLISLIKSDVISSKIAKDVFVIMGQEDKDPQQIVKEKGLEQITDTSEIEKMLDDVINSSPQNIEQYKQGKTKIIGWFVGQIMQKTKGKANPSIINKLLKQKLDSL